MAINVTARASDPAVRKLRQTGWILLILLVAAAFRLVALSSAPPGMTHDEADHGLTAWEIVNGARELYFTVGYGREPLYDYATALVMAGTGPTILAARLTSAYFSLLMIAAVYAWVRRAFGAPVGLLAAAGLAVGFWPVMAGRQALRSIALPAVFAMAVLFFWQALSAGQGRKGAGEKGGKSSPLPPFSPAPFLLFTIAGILLGLTFYTYIPARALWLAFPALAAYVALARPQEPGRLFGGTGLTLTAALMVAAPLLLYLANNPAVEVRIDELAAPLEAAAAGDFALLWANARGALRLFTVEGDQTWRYNIPGKPVLGPVMGALFYVGLLIAAWLAVRGLKNRVRPAGVRSEKLGFYSPNTGPGAFLALMWLVLGFAPVLVTGPGLSVTQAIGVLPVLYVFPALAMVGGFSVIKRMTERNSTPRRQDAKTPRYFSSSASLRPGALALNFFAGLLVLALFTTLAAQTARDYFGRWANEPEVRVQYETTMVTALSWLDARGDGAAAVSTITPSRYHTPAVALLTLRNATVQPRWFDGRESLLLPGEGGLILVPGFTPLPAELQPYLAGARLIDELPMRPDDLDRPVRIYALPGAPLDGLVTEGLPVRFGEHIELLGYIQPAANLRPGESLTLVTAWRLLQPLPEASLFTHVVGPAEPLAVADSLGAPGEAWVAGDVLLQLHAINLSDDLPAGEYPLAVGVYTRSDGRRLLTTDGHDMVTVGNILVGAEVGDE